MTPAFKASPRPADQIRAMRVGLASLVILLYAATAAASGSYVRPSSHRAGLDDYSKYELGKNVSQGRVALPDAEDERLEHQYEILMDLDRQLPRNTRSRLDLPALAGRLDSAQLDAVRYYLRVRYRVR